MASNQVGHNDEQFKASVDAPKRLEFAIEHLQECRGCVQRAALHGLGEGHVYTDVMIHQASEIASTVLEQIQKEVKLMLADKEGLMSHVEFIKELNEASSRTINKMNEESVKNINKMNEDSTDIVNKNTEENSKSKVKLSYKVAMAIGSPLLVMLGAIIG